MKISDKLLWDVPLQQREALKKQLDDDPVGVLEKNEPLFVKALNSCTWYELIRLLGPAKLDRLLTDETINKVFPEKRREYYRNARRLLSEYTLPSDDNTRLKVDFVNDTGRRNCQRR